MGRKGRESAVRNSSGILVDSDVFVGWIHIDDTHHEKARSVFHKIKQARLRMVTSSWVVAETATVLSHRRGQATAREYLKTIRDLEFPVIHVDEGLQEDATQIFEQQEKKGTSMVDCSNVAIIKRFEIPRIFSFDKFYAKKFGIQTLL